MCRPKWYVHKISNVIHISKESKNQGCAVVMKRPPFWIQTMLLCTVGSGGWSRFLTRKAKRLIDFKSIREHSNVHCAVLLLELLCIARYSDIQALPSNDLWPSKNAIKVKKVDPYTKYSQTSLLELVFTRYSNFDISGPHMTYDPKESYEVFLISWIPITSTKYIQVLLLQLLCLQGFQPWQLLT